MKKLNISIFIQTMQVGLKEHDTQFAVALNKPDEGFEIYYEDLSDKKISLLVGRQRPVPDGIKQASFVPELATVAIEYYEDTVMKGRNPFYKDDVMHEFSKVLGNEFKKRKRTLRRPMP